MYNPTHIANFFLSQKGSDCPIDNYKLNKLVYIAYGYSLAILDMKIFEESIQAWKYGPVIPSLYHEFKRFTNKPITELAIHYSETKNEKTSPKINSREEVLLNLLESVYQKYAHWSKKDFKEIIHHKDSPWDTSYVKNERYTRITIDKIKKHFKHLLPLEVPSNALREKLDQVCNDIKADRDKVYPIFEMPNLVKQT